jgi:hypothetical protein
VEGCWGKICVFFRTRHAVANDTTQSHYLVYFPVREAEPVRGHTELHECALRALCVSGSYQCADLRIETL